MSLTLSVSLFLKRIPASLSSTAAGTLGSHLPDLWRRGRRPQKFL
uniref:Uncharacterized protein n=1 Tax=Arundo donax TaxID=35708 RepID=A0A0A9C8Y8_ARUDO